MAKKSADIVNFFPAAPSVAPAKKKGAKAQKEINGLVEYATVCSVIKALETLAAGYKEGVSEQQRNLFLEEGLKLGRRPENFKGVEGPASASLELRKRSDRSPLDEVQVEVLKAYNVETAQVVDYRLNLEVATPEVLTKVSQALNKVPGIPPNLFLTDVKTVVTEASLDQVFKNKPVVAKQLIDLVGVLAVKPVLTEDFQLTLKRVNRLLEANTDQKNATAQ